MTQEPPRKYDFVKESSKRGPIRWTGLIVSVIVGGAAVYYVKQAKDEMEQSMLEMWASMPTDHFVTLNPWGTHTNLMLV